MEYVTQQSGVRLEIGRIPRKRIDDFQSVNPPPRAPIRTVEVFGGLTEEIEDERDPDYLAALTAYYFELGDRHLDLVEDAIGVISEIDEAALSDYAAVFGAMGNGDILRTVVFDDPSELSHVVGLVFYQSTVTPRGVEEAAERFGLTWHGQVVPVYPPKRSPLEARPIWGDRQAAEFNGWKWDDFCQLTGQRQSEEVAYYRLNVRLQWLKMNEKRTG